MRAARFLARSAVVLLSGGLDSATVLSIARSEGLSVHTLSFSYGQRHAHELQAAMVLSKRHGACSHRVAHINADIFQNSALTSSSISVPKNRASSKMKSGIPVTYVPARNTIFLSYALALAESMGSSEIFIGANAVDYSGYPDCRPVFLEAFQKLAQVATKAGVEGFAPTIRAPLLHWSKRRIVEEGLARGVDFSLTHSCYDPQNELGMPCKQCDACILRAEAFAQLGFAVDPAVERHEQLAKEAESSRA